MTTQPAKVDLHDLNLCLALAWSCHRRHATPVQAAFLEQPGVRLVDDAAITAGWRLVSFDQVFCRFADLLWLPLARE